MGLWCAQSLAQSGLSVQEGFESFICPLNQQVFVQNTASFSHAEGWMLDMQPYGQTAAVPDLPECPDSGFVLYKEHFAQADLQALQVLVQQSGFKQLAPYYRAYLMAKHLQEPLLLQIQLLQQASWQSASAHQEELLVLLEKVLEDASLSEHLRLKHLLLKAEYERRLGHFDAARRSTALAEAFPEEVLRFFKPIVNCEKELIASQSRQASPIPDERKQIVCGQTVAADSLRRVY